MSPNHNCDGRRTGESEQVPSGKRLSAKRMKERLKRISKPIEKDEIKAAGYDVDDGLEADSGTAEQGKAVGVDRPASCANGWDRPR
jgi:hypothetical protein